MQKKEREDRKKVTLFKSKKLTPEEDEDKFNGDFIDRMILEFEEDEKLNNAELANSESQSEDIYVKINKNPMEEEVVEVKEEANSDEEEGDDEENEIPVSKH